MHSANNHECFVEPHATYADHRATNVLNKVQLQERGAYVLDGEQTKAPSAFYLTIQAAPKSTNC